MTRPEEEQAFHNAIPPKRVVRAEGSAEAIIFVASEKASFITGQIIRVNGGKMAR